MIRVGTVVLHPFYIGRDNKPLKGKIVTIDSDYSSWEVLWEGDRNPEVCDRSDFIVPRKKNR